MVVTGTDITKPHEGEEANEAMTHNGSIDEQIEELETELERLNEKITDLCQLEQDWRSSVDQLASGQVSVEEELQAKQLGDGGEVDDWFGSSSSGESNTAISNGDDTRSVCSSTDDDFAYASDGDDDCSSSFTSWTTDEDVSYDAFSIQSDVAGFDGGDEFGYDVCSLSHEGPLQNGGSETGQEDEWDVFAKDRAYISAQQYGGSKQTQSAGEAEALRDRIRKAEEYTKKVEYYVKSEILKAAGVEDAIVSGESGVEAEWDAIVSGESGIEAEWDDFVSGESGVEAEWDAIVSGESGVEAEWDAIVSGESGIEAEWDDFVSGESGVEAEWDDFVKERADMQGRDVDGKKKKRFRGLRKLLSRIFRRKK